MPNKVFVSGCFDLLHSGHISFLESASKYGDVYVCIGSDNTIYDLKGRYPIISQDERKYILESLKYVKECRISRGSGILDFSEELNDIKPNIFIVNEDGNTPTKQQLCKDNNIEYLVLKREPKDGLPIRSTTNLRVKSTIPYRIDLSGGWLDQPYVNNLASGPVLTVSIEPTIEFNLRSGMSTSTRNKAIELWKTKLPSDDLNKVALTLFGYDNPPGTKEVSGSQDSIGIVFPGLNKLNYSNGYWPTSIESIHDDEILNWLESKLYLIPLEPRQNNYNVLSNTNITKVGAERLSVASSKVWESIMNRNLNELGKSFRESFESQIEMFPNMVDDNILNFIDLYKNKCLGYKLSGAGGGGYLILVNDKPIEKSIQIKIRRKDNF